eukprot:1994727-Rhodomonas_salina.1
MTYKGGGCGYRDGVHRRWVVLIVDTRAVPHAASELEHRCLRASSLHPHWIIGYALCADA